MNEAFLLTGGNMDERKGFLSKAKMEIEAYCGKIIQESPIYETAAWGKEDQPAFLNQVLKIETKLSSQELLKEILKIEEHLGRKRGLKYGPRTIDIDILFFNQEVIDLQGLKIPHPQMQNRRFVLVPLNDMAPQMIHPVFKKTLSQLLAECPDLLAVNKIS